MSSRLRVLHEWVRQVEGLLPEARVTRSRVLALFAPLMCVALTFTYALYGAGNSLFVMKVEGTLHGLCLIPLSYILALPMGLGLWGAWGAMIAYVTLMAGIMAWKFSDGSWKHIQI